MSKRAVFVSDLHLSANTILDDFTRDDDFAALLKLDILRPDLHTKVDLVLLGDTFDLWQSVSDVECEASSSSAIPLAYDSQAEAHRISSVAERHPRWFKVLGDWANQDNARVVFVTGNHDRALVDPAVQAAVLSYLNSHRADQPGFQNYYEDDDLALYADHGSQYDHNNQVETFATLDAKKDSAGYYFVKLFFNRLEHRDTHIENSPSGWLGVWHWLRRVANFPLLARAILWFAQYTRDARVTSHLKFMRAMGPESLAIDDPYAPRLLVSPVAIKLHAQHFFSEDPLMEDFFRDAYQQSKDVRVAVNEVLDARQQFRPLSEVGIENLAGDSSVRPEVPLPTHPPSLDGVPTKFFESESKDIEWAEGLFKDGPYFRAKLQPSQFKFVVFGHTHGEVVRSLTNDATYLNTGTWTLAKGPLPIVVAETSPTGPSARLVHFANGLVQ